MSEIKRVPMLQPNRAIPGDARDFTELSKRISDLSGQVSAENRPFLSGKLLEDVALTGGGSLDYVTHKLGRAYRGWTLVSIDAAATVRNATKAEIVTNGVDKSVHLPLAASAACTVSLMVF